MKRLTNILFLLVPLWCLFSYAQTPFDSFAPEISRPMLDIDFIRARDANNGGLFPSEAYGSYTPIYDGVLKCEWRAVYFENIIRSQAGLPLRIYYGYRTDGSTYWGVGPKMLSPDGKLINYPIF